MLRKTVLPSLCLLLLLSACQKTSDSYTGQWAFTTQKGEYAELWISEKALATVKGPANIPYVFGARHQADTTFIFDFGNSLRPFDRFVRLKNNGGKMSILQDGNQTQLTLLNPEVPAISNSEGFKNQMLKTFKDRAPQKNNE